MYIFNTSNNLVLYNNLLKCKKFTKGDLINKKFSNQELYIRLLNNVEKQKCLLLSNLNGNPEYLLKTLLTLNALKLNKASKIILILPYFSYERQDRINQKGEALSAKLIADLLKKAGANKILSLHLHSQAVRNFIGKKFLLEPDTITLHSQMLDKLKLNFKNLVLVAPDHGASKHVKNLANYLNIKDYIILQKYRPQPEKVKTYIKKTDIKKIKNKNIIIIDDIIQTGNTLIKAAEILTKYQAKKIYSVCTHADISNKTITKIKNSSIKKLICTNSILQKTHHPHILIYNIDRYLIEYIKTVL